MKKENMNETPQEYYVTWEDRYEPGEEDGAFSSLWQALQFAASVIEDGGWAIVSDGMGHEYDPFYDGDTDGDK